MPLPRPRRIFAMKDTSMNVFTASTYFRSASRKIPLIYFSSKNLTIKSIPTIIVLALPTYFKYLPVAKEAKIKTKACVLRS